MELIDCPACAGPDNAECDTCHGASEVTQEVHDKFMEEQAIFLANIELQRALASMPVENILGEEQSIIVNTTINDEIIAVIDGSELKWNESTGSWV